MLRPSMSQILEPGESYYMFVVAVAREARRIAKAEEEKREASKDLTLSEAKVSIVGQPASWLEEAPDLAAPEADPAPEEEDETETDGEE